MGFQTNIVLVCIILLLSDPDPCTAESLRGGLDVSLRGLDETALPVNQAAFSGETVTLRCAVLPGTDHRVQWWEYVTSSQGAMITDRDYINRTHPNFPRYTFDRSMPYEYHLTIRDVRPADSGTYRCQDVNARPTDKGRHSAELTVFGGPPDCTTTMPAPPTIAYEGYYYTAECLIKYGKSRNRLFMVWTGAGNFGQGQSIQDTEAWSGVAVYANRLHQGQGWKSTINFTVSHLLPEDKDTAHNVPTFTAHFETPNLIVHWWPTAMYAEPIKPLNEYLPGDSISCYADAFPTADFEWHNTRTDEKFPSSVFTIPAAWAGTRQSMTCKATNIINDHVGSNELKLDVNVVAPDVVFFFEVN